VAGEGADSDPIVIALAIKDPGLADRVAALLADVTGIRLVADGQPSDLRLAAPGPDSPPAAFDQPLTPRETEVLALLAQGASNKAIARALGISVHTAKFHVGQIIDKLDATGRTDAVAHAARRGVLHL
jgi:DNA-binding CsgD family transcriptional regulator